MSPFACLLSLCLSADPEIPKWIVQLGATAFTEREAAAEQLRRLGEPAIEALEAAAKSSGDLEVRTRAGRLATELRLKAASRKAIAPRTLTLNYANIPLASVINELNQKTGILVQLDPNSVRDPLRPITVTSNGPVPMWEAIELVAEAAGLREQFRSEIPLVNKGNRRGNIYGEEVMPEVNPSSVPVILTDGKPNRLPGARDSAVRIVALPGNFPGSRVVRGSGEAILNLDITPAPHVNWTDVVLVNVIRAEDETGRPVAASRLAELPTFGNGYQMVWMGGGWAINGYYGNQGPRSTMPNPRVVPITLKTDDRASRKLSIFEGVVIAEAQMQNAELLNCTNLESMIGVPLDAGSQRITVLQFDPQKDGTTRLKVRLEMLPVSSRKRGNVFNPFAMQVVMMDGVRGGNLLAGIQFRTKDGKTTATPKQGPVNMVEANSGYAQEFDLTFAKANRPAGLVVKGNKPVQLEIPFAMKNVPLP